MKPYLKSAAAIGLLANVLPAATLSLRWQNSDDTTLQRLVCEEAVMEIVLDLTEGETLSFAITFPSAAVVDGEGNVLEVVDFAPAPGQLEDATYDRSGIPPGNPFPYGEGIGFGTGQYGLILGGVTIQGPASLVLDTVVVHAITLGQAQITFSEGLLAPQVFDAAVVPYALLPAGTDELTGSLVLGVGDGRSGGVGPLVFEVVDELPAPVLNVNENEPANINDNIANDNGGSNGGGGATGLCGLGWAGPAGLTLLVLPLLRKQSR